MVVLCLVLPLAGIGGGCTRPDSSAGSQVVSRQDDSLRELTSLYDDTIKLAIHLSQQADTCQARGDYATAMQLYHDCNRYLFQKLNSQLALQYDIDEKDQTIEQQQRTIRFHRLSQIVVLTIFVLLLLVAATLWRIRQLRRQKKDVQHKYTLVLSDRRTEQGVASSSTVHPETERDREFLNKINDCLKRNIANPDLSSTTIADCVCLGQRQLNRRVKAVTGFDTTTYIRKNRILHAKHRLTHTDDPVAIILAECGFDNPSYFSRIFKQETGCTPTEYRKKTVEKGEKSDLLH